MGDSPDFEIKQILQCLKKNGYELERVEDSDDSYGNMNAIFIKDTPFSDNNGNYVNDSSIKVQIMFDSRIDTHHSYHDEDGDYEFDADNGYDFIEDTFNAIVVGGGKTKRNKTRKNKRGKKK